MKFNLSEQIDRRNKSVKTAISKRETGKLSFENTTNWINVMKKQLRELHFQRILESKQINAG